MRGVSGPELGTPATRIDVRRRRSPRLKRPRLAFDLHCNATEGSAARPRGGTRTPSATTSPLPLHTRFRATPCARRPRAGSGPTATAFTASTTEATVQPLTLSDEMMPRGRRNYCGAAGLGARGHAQTLTWHGAYLRAWYARAVRRAPAVLLYWIGWPGARRPHLRLT